MYSVCISSACAYVTSQFSLQLSPKEFAPVALSLAVLRLQTAGFVPEVPVLQVSLQVNLAQFGEAGDDSVQRFVHSGNCRVDFKISWSKSS